MTESESSAWKDMRPQMQARGTSSPPRTCAISDRGVYREQSMRPRHGLPLFEAARCESRADARGMHCEPMARWGGTRHKSAGNTGCRCQIDGITSRSMKELADVLATTGRSRQERLAARQAFLEKRGEIWEAIQKGHFPASYASANNKKFVGAPARTAIRCDFLLASKAALGAKYRNDPISDLAQRDLLF